MEQTDPNFTLSSEHTPEAEGNDHTGSNLQGVQVYERPSRRMIPPWLLIVALAVALVLVWIIYSLLW